MVMSVFTLPGFNTVFKIIKDRFNPSINKSHATVCLLYTSDAADELDGVDLGGRRIIKKKTL
ncbi:hypothetical protein JMUB7518_27970 [Staphylococcus aureus]